MLRSNLKFRFLPAFIGISICLELALLPQVKAQEKEAVPPAIDFETYQRNVDDIFHIYLMTSPNLDYGINGVIVDLNRKIAENPHNADSLISLGHVYRILGQPSEANRFYEKALKIDPTNFHLNIFSAMTNAQAKKFDKALEELSHAIEKNPADIYGWMARGRIYMMLRRNQEAESDFKKVLEIQPENRQTAFALSLVYQAMGEDAKAVEILQKLKEKNPDDLYVRYHLGALAFENKKIGEAITYWEELFKDGVRDIQFLLNLAIAYLENGQGEKAKMILGHLNFFFPREVDVEFLMAETYRQMNLLKEAERRYRLVLVEDPYYISAFIGLADVLEREGNVSESRKILQQAETSAKEISLIEEEKQQQNEIKKVENSLLQHVTTQ